MSLTSALVVAGILSAAQDTVVVHADGPPVWPGVRLEEVVSIGELNGPEEFTFGSIVSVSIGADGTLSVIDRQVPVVRQYSSAGVHLRDLGRQGEGPGEYLAPLGTGLLPDGRLALWDIATRRITVYGADGSADQSFRVKMSIAPWIEGAFRVDEQGRFYVLTSVWGETGPGSAHDAWIRLSPSGEIIDTLPVPRRGAPRSYSLTVPGEERRPFPIETVTALSPAGYLVSGHTDRYALFRPLPDGRILEIRREYDPVPITRLERQQWEEFSDYFAPSAKRMGFPFERPRIPREKPPFRDLFVDADGRIWVSMYVEPYEATVAPTGTNPRGRPPYRWREMPTWEVFTPNGVFLARMSLPPRTSIAAVRGRTVAALRYGDLGEVYVVVYRIESDEVGSPSSHEATGGKALAGSCS